MTIPYYVTKSGNVSHTRHELIPFRALETRPEGYKQIRRPKYMINFRCVGLLRIGGIKNIILFLGHRVS